MHIKGLLATERARQELVRFNTSPVFLSEHDEMIMEVFHTQEEYEEWVRGLYQVFGVAQEGRITRFKRLQDGRSMGLSTVMYC